MTRLLVSFRTLLCAETLFIDVGFKQPTDPVEPNQPIVDLCLSSIAFDDDGKPSLLTTSDSAAEHDLLIAVWFAHVQHIAELLESALRELDRGHIVAASVLVRTSVEAAARIRFGLDELKRTDDPAERRELLHWLATGEGRHPVKKMSLTEKVLVLQTTALEYLPEDSSVPSVYGPLCDLSHPRGPGLAVYLGERDDHRYLWPPTRPMHANARLEQAAKVILCGVRVAAAGMLAAWDDVADLESESNPDDRRGMVPYTLHRRMVVDKNSLSYPEYNLDYTIVQAVHSSFKYTFFNDDSVPMEFSVVCAHRYIERQVAGRSWPVDGTDSDALEGYKAVRIWICSELQQALIGALNRFDCASAGALARFALEHLTALDHALSGEDQQTVAKRLRTADSTRIDTAWLEKMVDQTGMSAHPKGVTDADKSIGDIIKTAADGLAHSDFDARSMYWSRFSSPDNTARFLQMPGRSRHFGSGTSDGLPLDNPWVVAGATMLLAERLLAPGRLLKPTAG